MKLTLLFASLLLTCVAPTLASITQDQTTLTDFSQRPAPAVSPEAKREMEANLADARVRYKANSNDPDAIIWLGRRLGYLGHFREAIEVYSEGIRKFPRDARFYRHRGHRFITLRKFSEAISDLKKAASLTKGRPDEIEPDGQPNARNTPTSTLQFNIWYHLGLAYYLAGNERAALTSYRHCLKVSNSPDRLVATTHWLYMTLRRRNLNRDAVQVLKPITEGMDIIENDGYYRLLLMYKGSVSPEALLAEANKQGNSPGAHSILYGVGNWFLYNGQREQALAIFRQITKSDQWTSFGFIAAEAELIHAGEGI